jgi:hypothetical protein
MIAGRIQSIHKQVMQAMLQMDKLDIGRLKRAHDKG